MSASIHAKKRLFTSVILVVSLIWCLIGGAVAYPYPVIIISGDDPVYVDAGISVGEVLQGKIHEETTSQVTTSTADSGTVANPVTTFWQSLTGQTITGIDDLPLYNAYKWAHDYGITSLGLPYARLDSPVLRYEFAMMMINYIENVEGKTISHDERCNISQYSDYRNMSAQLRTYVQKICDVGLMGWQSQPDVNKNITYLLSKFRPFDTLSTAELNIVAWRYVPTTIRLFPTSNARGDVIRFLYSISPTP